MHKLADNVMHFARSLRSAGMPVGPDRVLAAVQAVEAVGVERREDMHAALSAVMLDRHEQQTLFDAAFDAFWRDPALPPPMQDAGEAEREPRSHRVADALAALAPPRSQKPPTTEPPEEHRVEATLTFSERERLQRADFETMTADEFALARRLAEQLPIPVSPVLRRRRRRAPSGTLDLRGTLQNMARQPQTLTPAYVQAKRELPPIVVLLDISGSMERYARLFLHYVHGLTRRHIKVHTFTFGTRLTNVTRCLRHRDPDVALALADAQVADWKGGTRIAASLDSFNRRWARRVLGANAAVLLVTDGLDRDDAGALSAAAALLHRSAHEVVWLNPLLRFDGFEPRAAGVRALLPHVDRFLPVHNLASLADLGRALREGPRRRPPSGLH